MSIQPPPYFSRDLDAWKDWTPRDKFLIISSAFLHVNNGSCLLCQSSSQGHCYSSSSIKWNYWLSSAPIALVPCVSWSSDGWKECAIGQSGLFDMLWKVQHFDRQFKEFVFEEKQKEIWSLHLTGCFARLHDSHSSSLRGGITWRRGVCILENS